MQKARCHGIAPLQPLVGAWFQGLFTPLLTVLFTFPSQYLFTIGLLVVFSLTGWCRQFQAGFLRSRPTQDTVLSISLRVRGYHPLSRNFPVVFHSCPWWLCQSYNPEPACWFGLGSSAFARHYLRNHCYFLFLQVLRCFSSPRSRFCDRSSIYRVSPFGHLRIKARLQLPVTFRSLPRPSSSPRA